jgi:hypothetical protein
MNISDKKQTATTKDQKQSSTEQVIADTPSASAANELQKAIDQLDAELKTTLKIAVEQLTPGGTFNPGLVKEISKIETRKIRLITGHLDTLMRKGNHEVKEIVERLLAIKI